KCCGMNGAMLMYVRRGPWSLLVLLLASLLAPRTASAQLIEGLESYSDAVVGLSTTRWAGPRVPAPERAERPPATQQLDSRWWPLRVYAGPRTSPSRLRATLHAAESSFEALFLAGFLTSFGDGDGARDLYLVDQLEPASAGIDALGNFSGLDGARAFATVDVRLPGSHLASCVARALLEAQLLELDPAENAALRRGVAAYFAWLSTGQSCEDEPRARPEQNPFATVASAQAWLERLSARQDRNRGTFLFDMWQFARQRTWEGADLRGSPDLLEAIAKALAIAHDDFELVAGELAEGLWNEAPARTLSFAALPAFPDKRAPPLEVLGSAQLRIHLGEPRPGTRLRAWSRAEGGRYTLSALRMDALGAPLSRLELPARTNGQLSIELDARTFAVAITLTRVADLGLPDPDAPSPEPRSAGLIVDVAP
ncbi:MAG TPA: hypothetical protein VI299_28785, partial [Polyangiales bacterium]